MTKISIEEDKKFLPVPLPLLSYPGLKLKLKASNREQRLLHMGRKIREG